MFKVNVNLIVRNQNNELLLVKVGKGTYDGRWSLPGGTIESGEKLVETAKREALEETGIAIDVKEFVCLGELMASGGHMFVIIMAAEALNGSLRAGIDQRDAKWFGEKEAMELLLPFGKKAIECQKSRQVLFIVEDSDPLPKQ